MMQIATITEKVDFLNAVNHINSGEIHAAIDTIVRLIAEGKGVHITPAQVNDDDRVYPAFSVSVHGEAGNVWTSEPDTILSDALADVWTSIPEVK